MSTDGQETEERRKKTKPRKSEKRVERGSIDAKSIAVEKNEAHAHRALSLCPSPHVKSFYDQRGTFVDRYEKVRTLQEKPITFLDKYPVHEMQQVVNSLELDRKHRSKEGKRGKPIVRKKGEVKGTWKSAARVDS